MSSEILPKNILGDDFLKYVYCYNNEKDIEERAYTFHIGFFYKNNTSILPLENLIIKNHQSKIENLLLTYMYYIKYTILKGQYVGNIPCPDTLQGSNDEFEKIISKTITDAQNNIVKILSESITRAVNSSQQLVKTNDNSDTESTPSLLGDKNTEAAEAAAKKAEEEKAVAAEAEAEATEKKAGDERIAAEAAAAKKAEEERIAAEKKKAEEEKAAADKAAAEAEKERIATEKKVEEEAAAEKKKAEEEKAATKKAEEEAEEKKATAKKAEEEAEEEKATAKKAKEETKDEERNNENKDRPVDVNKVQIKMRKEESEEEEKSKFITINDELFKFDVKVLTNNVYQDGGKEMITKLENLKKKINNVQNQTKKMNLLKHYYSVFLDFNGILLMKKIIQYIDKNNNKDDEREINRKNEIIEIQKKLDNIFVEIENKTLQIQTISTNESEKDESKEITEGKIHVFLDKMFLLELFLIFDNIKNKKVIGSIGYFIETNDKITIPFVKITISELIKGINKYNENLDKKQSFNNV